MGDKAPRRFKRFYEEEGEFEILTLANWFSHYSYSRTSIHSSMGGGWLGKYSMLSKVLKSKKKEKKKEREKKRKMKEKREE